MKLPVPNRTEIKKEAKLAKGFMVMVKAKLNKDVLCRSVPFRRLMSLVFHDEEETQVWFQNKRLGLLGKEKRPLATFHVFIDLFFHIPGSKCSDSCSLGFHCYNPEVTPDGGFSCPEEPSADEPGEPFYDVDLDDVGSDEDCDDGGDSEPEHHPVDESQSRSPMQGLFSEEPSTMDSCEMIPSSQPFFPEDAVDQPLVPEFADSPPGSPLVAFDPSPSKGIEPDDCDKMIVIEDTPDKGSSGSMEDLNLQIQNIQQALLHAKKMQMAKSFVVDGIKSCALFCLGPISFQ